jgi:hypothetical protein
MSLIQQVADAELQQLLRTHNYQVAIHGMSLLLQVDIPTEALVF